MVYFQVSFNQEVILYMAKIIKYFLNFIFKLGNLKIMGFLGK